MDREILQEVIECLPKDRTLFHYFKGRYAPMLLSSMVGEGKTITEIKRGPFASLLSKQEMKGLLAEAGVNWLDSNMLEGLWSDENYPFVLTLSEWGGAQMDWQQTSRRGYNLVLQLNFANGHNCAYQELVRPSDSQRLNWYGHPVQRKGQRGFDRDTLAWARIDLDFDAGEALIEEVQSDWVREAIDMLDDARYCIKHDRASISWLDVGGSPEDIIKYVEQVL